MTPPPLRTDRIGLLLDQLVDAIELSRARIDGITTDELMWEPHPGMWSIRHRSDAASPDAYGPGDYLLERDHDLDPFTGGPLSTAAWRVGHLVSMFAGRYHWTFGERTTHPDALVDFTTGTDLVDRLWAETDRWVDAVEQLQPRHLDQVGFGAYPDGLDPHLPFITIVRWMNREAIHHLAEVALIRDLYRHR